MTRPTSIAVVGLGKIAQDQHLPIIQAHPDFDLVATVSHSTKIEGVANHSSLEALLAVEKIEAVALCLPPQPRFEWAMQALKAGKHVLLEKPPGVNVAQVYELQRQADAQGVVLYASWHSRHAPAVAKAKQVLACRTIKSVDIKWCEDVEKWHPGQGWIWQPGGMGVFDPGINALSILTELVVEPLNVEAAELVCPLGKEMPITADMKLVSQSAVPISARFDWSPIESEIWQIVFDTDQGLVVLTEGGAALHVDGAPVGLEHVAEYRGVYDRFADLLRSGCSDVDHRPLALVEQAFAKK